MEEELALTDLPDALVFEVLSALDDATLVQTRVLCARFRLLADLLLSERFLRRWPLAGLATAPPAPTCLVPVRLEHFVLRHVVGRGDSLARIAVKYGTTVPVVKRLNNILSDHTLMTRDAIFVPVDGPGALENKRVAHTFCLSSKRRYLVVLREGEDPPPPQPTGPGRERAVEQLSRLLQRGLRVDDGTARYYIAQAGGNIRAAIAAFEDDQRWARVMRAGRRR